MKTWVEKKGYTRRLKNGKKVTVMAHKQQYRIKKIGGAKRGRKKMSSLIERVDSISFIDEMETLLAPYVNGDKIDFLKYK